MLVGGYSAALGWRPGAYLLLTALFRLGVGHHFTGITEYRRLMRRPWPELRTLDITKRQHRGTLSREDHPSLGGHSLVVQLEVV